MANFVGTSRAVSPAMNQSSYSRGLAFALGCAAWCFAPSARADSEVSDEVADTDSDEAPDEGETGTGFVGSPLLTGQLFWAQGKVMPGFAIGVGTRFVEVDLEVSMLTLTEAAPPRDLTFLGNQFGAHVMFVPLHEEHIDLGIGLGGDFYWLWGVHSDAVESAFALKAASHVWLTPKFGLYASARVYPWTSSGVELGTDRESKSGLPVLFSTGITWRL